MSDAKFETQLQSGSYKIIVSGPMTGRTDFPAIPAEAARVEIELQNLSALNSAGIRQWMDWMDTLGPRNLLLRDCPPFFIDQVNMIEGFLPNDTRIESFWVPYFNPETDSETRMRWIRGQHFGEGVIREFPHAKDEQGNVLQLDVARDKFFRFVKKYT